MREPEEATGRRFCGQAAADARLTPAPGRSGAGAGQSRSCPPGADRLSPPPVAPPAEAGGAPQAPAPSSWQQRQQALAALRQRLAAEALRNKGTHPGEEPPWTLGAPQVDDLLACAGLESGGVHEIKVAGATPGAAGAAGARAGPHRGGVRAADRAAAVLFALGLVRRRLGVAAARRTEGEPPAVLWCEPRREAGEIGRLYAPGLAGLGIAPGRLIVVTPRRPEEVLWAAEEGLRSGALGLVVAMLDEVALTPSRRLALAAERRRTPCLLLTGPGTAAAATATRWRIARAPAAAHVFDAQAPGAPRVAAVLERCRARPLAAERSFVLEWSDASYRFDLVAGLADGAVAGGGAPRPTAGRLAARRRSA